ncbi:MAG TPA: serpin family protein, partial [Gemmatimonadales bacterium]|nr:serpin family protein [Gemmatimonadales bacterium]
EWDARAEQDSALAAAGRVDSMLQGLVHVDTTAGYTYERFGIRLLRAAVHHSGFDTSRVLSPLSAGQAMALALGAARDSSALAIEQGLEIGDLGSEGLAARSRRFNRALGARRDITLKIANAFWVDTSATLQPVFARWAADRFDATVRTQALHTQQFVSDLNRWSERETNGAIPKLRDKPYGDSVKVVLANAVYFKGRWLEPFDSSLTEDRPFTTINGERLTTPTMERTANFGFRQGPGYRTLRIPYAGGLTAMYVVLPDSGVRAERVLDTLERSGWPIPNTSRESRSVHVQLPRLHLVQATDLRPPFTALGMGILFDSARADFSGLVVRRPDQPPFCPPLASGKSSFPCTRYRISEAAQNVFLDLDERGTVAAAVTSMGFEVALASVPPPPIQFIVDRPFLFALRDERTGTLLFVGYVASPRQ